MRKIKILDTNVLMHDPKALFAFDNNDVVIPLIVLDELDKHKNGANQAAKHARMVIRSLDELRALGNISEGVLTERGGKIRVELNNINNIPNDLDPGRADNRIISVALSLKKKHPNVKVAVITKDVALRVKCDAIGVKAEDYTSDYVVGNLDQVYTGYSELTVNGEDIDKVYQDGCLKIDGLEEKVFVNEYIHLKSFSGKQQSALTKFNGEILEKIKIHNDIWGISSRNKEQKYLMSALFDQRVKLVTVSGRAGTGKSLLSLLAGVAQVVDADLYKRMVVTRPIQSVGKELGFLPGSLEEKLAPWMIPMYDNLDIIFSDRGSYYIDHLKEEGKIEIEPLSYIRGRSINKSFMIIDEVQNLSKHEIKTIITRAGFGTKVILTGDIEQIDVPYLDYSDNGLSYVIEKFKDEPIAAHVTLIKGERSGLATLAAEKL